MISKQMHLIGILTNTAFFNLTAWLKNAKIKRLCVYKIRKDLLKAEKFRKYCLGDKKGGYRWNK